MVLTGLVLVLIRLAWVMLYYGMVQTGLLGVKVLVKYKIHIYYQQMVLIGQSMKEILLLPLYIGITGGFFMEVNMMGQKKLKMFIK